MMPQLVTEVWSNDKLLGIFTPEELELWFAFYWDEYRDYRMFDVWITQLPVDNPGMA